MDSGYALLKMPSGEIRKVRTSCTATIGQLSNAENMNVRIGKAGRKRHMGFRPSVRGKVMDPVTSSATIIKVKNQTRAYRFLYVRASSLLGTFGCAA
jgi:hypothetical protein